MTRADRYEGPSDRVAPHPPTELTGETLDPGELLTAERLAATRNRPFHPTPLAGVPAALGAT